MYAQSNRYSEFLLSLGFKSRELVGFYLTNSPEFLMAILGTWAVGSAPAMINYHLAGEALVHCLRVAGAKLLLVDWDDECRQRIEDVRGQLEGDLGMKIVILDTATKGHINSLKGVRPPDSMRSGMPLDYPMALIYTRYVDYRISCVNVIRMLTLNQRINWPSKGDFIFSRKNSPARTRQKGELNRNTERPERRPVLQLYVSTLQLTGLFINIRIGMPIYHGTGGTVAFGCMLGGTTLCLGKKFSTSKFWDDVRDSRATAMVYVGETARYLLSVPESPRDKENDIRIAFGNGLRPDVWKKFQDRFGIETIAEFFNSTEGVFGLLNLCRGVFSSQIS
jgi:acyl-CoA synthetase (AMP-forming)/AMP-acid ligase II